MALKEVLERQLERIDRIANNSNLDTVERCTDCMVKIGGLLLQMENETESNPKVYGIRACRKAAGMTQEELAERVGTARSALAMWEAGKSNPRIETLRKVADALGCTVDDLLREDNGSDSIAAVRKK